MKNKIGKNGDFIDSLNIAIEGIVDAMRTERNLKFHLFCGIIAAILIIFLGVTRLELMGISISIALVLLAELLNTSIECIVDLVSPRYHILAKRAKDIAAGAVLITALNALIVGYLVFHQRISVELGGIFDVLKKSYNNSMVFIIAVILILVIILKIYFKRGTPLRGGIPSGHSALGGALFTGIFFLTDDSRIFYLAFFLLILVLQSRIEGKIHTAFETLVGAFLGIVITYVFLTALGV